MHSVRNDLVLAWLLSAACLWATAPVGAQEEDPEEIQAMSAEPGMSPDALGAFKAKLTPSLNPAEQSKLQPTAGGPLGVDGKTALRSATVQSGATAAPVATRAAPPAAVAAPAAAPAPTAASAAPPPPSGVFFLADQAVHGVLRDVLTALGAASALKLLDPLQPLRTAADGTKAQGVLTGMREEAGKALPVLEGALRVLSSAQQGASASKPTADAFAAQVQSALQVPAAREPVVSRATMIANGGYPQTDALAREQAKPAVSPKTAPKGDPAPRRPR
jgi:hypothetical protein